MDVQAKKDTYEKEEEEAERLIRPAPKKKPPRRDKRRERIKEYDPDLDEKDPDLSMNYKTIGGSHKESSYGACQATGRTFPAHRKSTYPMQEHGSLSTTMRVSPMRASVEIRKVATEYRDTHPEVAMDLLALATRVAEQEQTQTQQAPAQVQQQQAVTASQKESEKHMQAYRKLRASVVSAAKADPNARKALQPTLRLIKEIG